MNDFVIVRMTGITDYGFKDYRKGQIKIWKDYGETWGSSAYEVLDYVTGYIEASKRARYLRNEQS